MIEGLFIWQFLGIGFVDPDLQTEVAYEHAPAIPTVSKSR